MKSLAVLSLMLTLLAGTSSGQFSWRQTAGPNGGSVLSMVKDQHGRLLAGCQFGAIYRIAPNGNAWLRVNPGMTDRDIAGIACSPVDGAIYAGSRGRAVYVSRDDGETWNRTPGQPASVEVVSMLVRLNGDVVAGTFGGGVYVSTNGGTTWTETNVGLVSTPRKRIAALVELNATMFAATGGGVMEYTASGWEKRESGLPDSVMNDLFVSGGGELFAAQGFRGVWRSSDAGLSWEQVGTTAFTAVSVAETPGGVLLASDAFGGVRAFTSSAWSAANELPVVNAFAVSGDSVFASAEGGVYRSRDEGSSWQQVNNGLANGWVLSLLVTDTGPIFAGTAHNAIMRLPFAGSDWFQPDVPPDPSSPVLGLAASDGGDLFAATQYWGLWKSTDNGATWASSTHPPLPGSLHAIVAGAGDLLFAGSNGGGSANGVYRSTDAGSSWQKVVTGLVMPMVQSLAYDRDRDILYAGTYGGGAFVSTNRGDTWDSAGVSNPYVMAMTIARSTGEAFAAGGSGGGKVYRSTNQGQSWVLDSVPTWRSVVALAYDDVRGVLYAGTVLDGVFRLPILAGGSWEQVNDGLTNLEVDALAADEVTGTVYAGVRGGGVVAGFASPPGVLSRTRANLGLPIPDPGTLTDATTLVATGGLSKPSGDAVTEVVVTIGDIMHPSVGELTVSLAHQGVEVELLSALAGADLIGLVLSDTAIAALGAGSSPYTGSFRPAAPLSAFAGTDPEGPWTLIISDAVAGNAGTLNGWGLTVTVGPATAAGPDDGVPSVLVLEQNYPNPFNPETTIRYSLPTAGWVRLELFDLLGRRVRTLVDGVAPAGTHVQLVDGSSLASGIYLYRLSAGGAVLSRRMLLIK